MAAHGQNDMRMEDLVKEVRELGRDAANGADSLPKLALRIVRAANEGVISLEKDDNNRDDAAKIYEEYAKAFSKKAVHTHTDNGTKANISKLRQLVAMGCMTTCDPVDVLNRAIVIRKELVAADEKVKPVYAGFVDIARAQIARDTELDDDELKAAIRKGEPKAKELEKMLANMRDTLEKIITGDNKWGIKDSDERTEQAFNFLRDRCAAMVLRREQDEFAEKARALGFKVNVEEYDTSDDALLRELEAA